jgi:arylsulfatase A-like enzyme
MSGSKITRKDFLRLGGAGLGALALSSTPLGGPIRKARAATSTKQPNILFITVDQLHSLADLPKGLPLPTFERVAAEGRNFNYYHIHQAPCGPSRSVIYTGQYVQKTGVYTNPPGETDVLAPNGPKPVELPESFVTIGKMLREQGYYTAYKGKWHLSPINQITEAAAKGRTPDYTKSLEPYGFSDYNFDGEHTGLTWAGFGHDGVIAADTANLLYHFSNGHSQGKPWYLAVNFINPHDIMFLDSELEPSGNNHRPPAFAPLLDKPHTPFFDKDWKFPLPKSFYADDLSTKPAAQRFATGRGKLAKRDEATWLYYQNYYFNCIRDVDRHIKTVLDALERYGFADNTIVLLTSDHGEQAGAHGMLGKGADVYKETVRVPLFIRHPDVKGGAVTDALAGTTDLTPTILGFAGLSDQARAERYPDLKGVDLEPVIADVKARTDRDKRGILFDYMTPGRIAADVGIPENPPRMLIRGVFDGRHKFARYFRVTEHNEPRDWDSLVAHNDLELYDIKADPDELTNLAHKPDDHKDLILALNEKTNALIDNEIGKDDGSIYPGPTEQYNTLAQK